MTSEERKALREALLAQGFKRQSYTDDFSGTGVYTEVYERNGNLVTVSWGERTK